MSPKLIFTGLILPVCCRLFAETVICPNQIEAFDPSNPSQPIGVFQANTPLEVGDWDPSAHMFHVSFKNGNEAPIQAFCRAEDLKKQPPPENEKNDSGFATASNMAAKPGAPVSSSWLTGANGFNRALDEQKRNSAPIVIFVTESTCGHCAQVVKLTETDPKIKNSLSKAIKVRLDSVGPATDKELIKKFDLHSGCFHVLKASGEVIPTWIYSFEDKTYNILPHLGDQLSELVKKGSS